MEDWKTDLLKWSVVIVASLAGAVIDLRTRRIPNALCGPLLVAGLLWNTYQGGLGGLAEAALACVVLALPFVLLFLIAKGGAGDAKIMGAIGAWLGLREGVIVLLCVCIAGVILAILTAITKKCLKTVLVNILLSVYNFVVLVLTRRKIGAAATEALPDKTDKLMMPYGVAIFVGVCLAAAGVWLWQ